MVLGMIIRRAFASDLEAILTCLQSLAEVEIGKYEATIIFQKMLHHKIQLWVVEDFDRVVGTATLILEPKLIHKGSTAVRIEDVAIHKDFQRRGYGSKLVGRLVDEAKRAGAYKVSLSCSQENSAFYERLGFQVHGAAMRLNR